MNILSRAHTYLLYFGGAYAALLAILCLEPVQRSLIYLHHIKWAADFHYPESYGYLPGKVFPFNLTTPDGVTIGVWQVLPQDIYDGYVEVHGLPAGPLPRSVFDAALASDKHPTVLYCHGNAATRAAFNRVALGRYMSTHNNNFLIFDYRGFADSSPVNPSEKGLLIDARTAWDYLAVEKQVPADRIVVMSQSLGTGVATGLVASLGIEGVIPRALIIVAPFASIPSLLSHYKLFNLLPILGPFRSFPWAMEQFFKVLTTKFESIKIIRTIRAPILILHALNDPTIPHHESASLFDHLLEPYESVVSVKTMTVGGWGIVSRFPRPGGEGYWGDVIRAEAVRGGHNDIQSSEMSLKLADEMIKGGYRKLG